MPRVWWPEPLYEIKPFGALTLGVPSSPGVPAAS